MVVFLKEQEDSETKRRRKGGREGLVEEKSFLSLAVLPYLCLREIANSVPGGKSLRSDFCIPSFPLLFPPTSQQRPLEAVFSAFSLRPMARRNRAAVTGRERGKCQRKRAERRGNADFSFAETLKDRHYTPYLRPHTL
jgi:hypothetical protein